MIQVNAIDVSAAEIELLQQAAHLLEARLFPKRTNKKFQFTVDVTRQPYRQPIIRDQLVGRSGLGYKPPKKFAAVVSLAGGLSDAIETLAHELIHIAQVRAGRLKITRKKLRKQKITVHRAKWLKEKPVMIDEVLWQQRPWEIEACRWQVLLRDDVVALMSGLPRDLLTQKGKTELGLYSSPVLAPLQQAAAPAPQAMPPQQMPAQQMPAQQMQPQQMPTQQMPTQQMPAQSMPAQPIPAQAMTAAPAEAMPTPPVAPAPVEVAPVQPTPVAAAVISSQPVATQRPAPAQQPAQQPAFPTASVVRAVAPAPAAPAQAVPAPAAEQMPADQMAPEQLAPDQMASEQKAAAEIPEPAHPADKTGSPIAEAADTPAPPADENLVADLGVDLSAVGFGAPAPSLDTGQTPEESLSPGDALNDTQPATSDANSEDDIDTAEAMAELEKPAPVEASIEDDALIAELMSGDIEEAAPMEIPPSPAPDLTDDMQAQPALPEAELDSPELDETESSNTESPASALQTSEQAKAEAALDDIAASVAAAMPSAEPDQTPPKIADANPANIAGDMAGDRAVGVSVPGTGTDPFGPVPDLGALDSVVVAGETKFDVPRQIFVEGLGETRTLNADSLQSKLDELKQRGLVLDEDVKRAKESAEPS